MEKVSIQKMVLQLVKNDTITIDDAITLTDEETNFLYACTHPTEDMLVPDCFLGGNEIELEAGELLFCYRRNQISLETHFVYIEKDCYGKLLFKFVLKAPLEQKKEKIAQFKKKYEVEFKKYINGLNLTEISNFLDQYAFQTRNINTRIFEDKEFTNLVIFRLITSEDYDMFDAIEWNDENLELVKRRVKAKAKKRK